MKGAGAAAGLLVFACLCIGGQDSLHKLQKSSDMTISISASAVQESGMQTPAMGPGRTAFPFSDPYGIFQWALLNNGGLKLIPGETHEAAPGIGERPHVVDEADGPFKESQETVYSVPGIDIDILPAWKKYEAKKEKRPVIVALIDTGTDYTHEDLKDSIWVNQGEIAGDGIDNDKNGFIDDIHGWNFYSDNNQIFVGDEDYHGTHAAGTIDAQRNNKGITGINDPRYVKIMVLKALGTKKGIGTPKDVVRAIRYAQANGASICNLSFGTRKYSKELYETMKQSNMLFVVAAGNGDRFGNGEDLSKKPLYPASFDLDNMITVANLQFDGTLDPSSNYGPNVDLAAPGSYILSTVPGNRYGFITGTSMAAPMVTGAAALLYSYDPDLSLADVKHILTDSARTLDNLRGRTAYGKMLDVSAAVDTADGMQAAGTN